MAIGDPSSNPWADATTVPGKPSRKNFDAVAPDYDASRALPPDSMEALVDALASVLGAASPILDLGVGTGRFGLPLQRRGLPIIGVDLSTAMLSMARVKGFRDAVRADGAWLPFPDAAFDATLMVHFLHLLPDWPAVLAEVARVTRFRLVTVVQRKVGPRGPFDRYSELIEASGAAMGDPGLREEYLALRIPPETFPGAEFEEAVDMDAALERLARRTYSSQWSVPEEAHRRAVETVVREYRGRRLVRHHTISILAWDVKALADMRP